MSRHSEEATVVVFHSFTGAESGKCPTSWIHHTLGCPYASAVSTMFVFDESTMLFSEYAFSGKRVRKDTIRKCVSQSLINSMIVVHKILFALGPSNDVKHILREQASAKDTVPKDMSEDRSRRSALRL